MVGEKIPTLGMQASTKSLVKAEKQTLTESKNECGTQRVDQTRHLREVHVQNCTS